jgi:hypothetical protein
MSGSAVGGPRRCISFIDYLLRTFAILKASCLTAQQKSALESQPRRGGERSEMPNFKVAHILQQGVDLIIVPLDSSFGSKPPLEQRQTIGELQMRAASAGLRGTVVPVWDNLGHMMFIAPQQWHPFFSGLDLGWVWANVNRELFW